MTKSPYSYAGSDLRAFRFRLRHDHILRARLRHLKQLATIELARELGFQITLEDLKSVKSNSKDRTRTRSD